MFIPNEITKIRNAAIPAQILRLEQHDRWEHFAQNGTDYPTSSELCQNNEQPELGRTSNMSYLFSYRRQRICITHP